MSQNLPEQSLWDFLSLRHPNHFVLASANNRNVIITYRFLAAPVQGIQIFSILTVWLYISNVSTFLNIRASYKSASSGFRPLGQIPAGAMTSSNKTGTQFYFIIQQLTLNKPFKCDCAGCKKKHGFSTFKKWQIWSSNFTIVKTQLVHGISIWNKNCIEAYILCCFLCLNISGGIPNAPRRETKIWRVFWHEESTCNKQVSMLGILILYRKQVTSTFKPYSEL